MLAIGYVSLGETLVRAMTLIESAKANGLDPQAYLTDVVHRLHDKMSNRHNELLPWNWAPIRKSIKTRGSSRPRKPQPS